MNIIRRTLITWLAGNATVALNAKIENGGLVVNAPDALVRNVAINGATGAALTVVAKAMKPEQVAA